jgi:hypothetical protein
MGFLKLDRKYRRIARLREQRFGKDAGPDDHERE